MDKFELKRPADVKNFYEVIELDGDCANLYCNIKEGEISKVNVSRKITEQNFNFSGKREH